MQLWSRRIRCFATIFHIIFSRTNSSRCVNFTNRLFWYVICNQSVKRKFLIHISGLPVSRLYRIPCLSESTTSNKWHYVHITNTVHWATTCHQTNDGDSADKQFVVVYQIKNTWLTDRKLHARSSVLENCLKQLLLNSAVLTVKNMSSCSMHSFIYVSSSAAQLFPTYTFSLIVHRFPDPLQTSSLFRVYQVSARFTMNNRNTNHHDAASCRILGSMAVLAKYIYQWATA